MGAGASGPTVISDAGAAAVSYLEFFAVLESLVAGVMLSVSGRLHGSWQEHGGVRWGGPRGGVEDIDERIEARERRSVAAIFAQQGDAFAASSSGRRSAS